MTQITLIFVLFVAGVAIWRSAKLLLRERQSVEEHQVLAAHFRRLNEQLAQMHPEALARFLPLLGRCVSPRTQEKLRLCARIVRRTFVRLLRDEQRRNR